MFNAKLNFKQKGKIILKVYPIKGGHGHVTAYRISIGSAAARRCGFVDENGERYELETVELPGEKAVIIKVKQQPESV